MSSELWEDSRGREHLQTNAFLPKAAVTTDVAGSTDPVIEQRGDPVEQPDQQGVLIAPDGLQLRVTLILKVKPAQSIYDLQGNTHTHRNRLRVSVFAAARRSYPLSPRGRGQ